MSTQNSQKEFDCDWLVIGSGFGGSVSALRLAEKGYSVQVLECGKRYEDHQMMKSTWNLHKLLWAPFAKLYGIMRVTMFEHVAILSGSAVGGGSLTYAATLYRAADDFYHAKSWAKLGNWRQELSSHYNTAEYMLGVTNAPFETQADRTLKRIGGYLGCADTFQQTNVGLYFGDKPGETVSDPFFDGEGPDRTACIKCGACMSGCRFGAKNTLMKNYLWFAEKLGVKIHELTEVVDIRPIGSKDGSEGYEITTQRTGAWFIKQQRTFRAKGISVNAGALNTNRLLAKCKLNGSLPHLSDRLGEGVRTNSETLMAVTFPEGNDFSQGIAISSSIFPDRKTHIEMAHPGRWGGAWKMLFTLLTPPAPLYKKPFLLIGAALRHPIWFLRTLWPFGWVKRSAIIGIMQSTDSAIRFRFGEGMFGHLVMRTEQDPDNPIPTEFPILHDILNMLAENENVMPQGIIFESLLGKTVTAHILGGAVIGEDADRGVVNAEQKAFNYKNLLICDGSVFPANPGVNPSLTITALAERAMTFIPRKSDADCETADVK